MQSLSNDPAFRQRKYYWRKKGLNEEAAIEKALSPVRKTKGGTEITLLPRPAATKTAPIIDEAPAPKSPKTSWCRFDAKPVLLSLVFISFVSLCSYLLISFTAEALGGDLTAWLMASLLELGAMTLAVVRTRSLLQNLACKLTSAFLVCLTLFLLHGGLSDSHEQSSREESALQQRLANLTEMKALVKGQLEALPHTHLTRRQVLIDKLTVLDRDTSQILTDLTSSQSELNLTVKNYTDFALRLALVMMNLLFARLFFGQFRKKEDLLTTVESSVSETSIPKPQRATLRLATQTAVLVLSFTLGSLAFDLLRSPKPLSHLPRFSSLAEPPPPQPQLQQQQQQQAQLMGGHSR
jgi:hypothetical protein